MKTTIEISDALFDAAKRHAARRGTTLRALVEDGLRTVIAADRKAEAFILRDASVRGRGLRPGVREGGWERVVELVYEGHGA